MTFDDLQKTIGIQFHNKSLLRQAFAHRSYLNESKDIRVSNERLEFLGDSILSFLTSSYLYETFPQFPEGTLTNIRSSLVKTKSLSEIAARLHLGELLLLSHGEEDSGGRNNTSLLADTFEALLGAIFLDQGLRVAKQFVELHVTGKTRGIIDKKEYIDYKSLLQETIQEQSKISPTYVVTKSEGPDHAKTFWIDARAAVVTLGAGVGKSKQEAEQQAALNALEKMGKI